MSENLPKIIEKYKFVKTGNDANAFTVDDPLVQLIYNYGSFLPGGETYYSNPEAQMLEFIETVGRAARLYPEAVLQYAAWLRDPKNGKGNRSQPPWVLAVAAGIEEVGEQPRLTELVAKCVVRPDDAINIVQASHLWQGDNSLLTAMKQGLADGLAKMSDYQLAKYANAALNLLPEKRPKKSKPSLTEQTASATTELTTTPEEDEEMVEVARSLRLVDVLGICKAQLNPRLFALYRYLHAPTRMQPELLPLLNQHLPLFETQKQLRSSPPRSRHEVKDWLEQALEARMTMEQIFSAVPAPVRKMPELPAPKAKKSKKKDAAKDNEPPKTKAITISYHENLSRERMRAELWKNLATARVPAEDNPAKLLPFIGDVAFMRNIRPMVQAGVPIKSLQDEARQRNFNGIWPFQIMAVVGPLKHGSRRGDFESEPCPEALPVLDTIFEQIALTPLPRKPDGSYYKMLGLADVSGSMSVRIGSPTSRTTCMDASIAFTVAASFTTRTRTYGGLAGSYSKDFYPVEAGIKDGPLAIAEKVRATGGMGGTQIFGTVISLINWLLDHPKVPRPEVLVVYSDMQFSMARELSEWELRTVPDKYKQMIKRPEFKDVPPLAAAIVIYREILGQDVNLVLWNLASYSGSPVPSGMPRVMLLSGFDANSFKIMERWLRAGSPGTAMPTETSTSANPGGDSSFQATLDVLRGY